MKPGFGNIQNIFGGKNFKSSNSKILFWGKYSDISGGHMPNKVTGATDYLTVSGSAGGETYQCPNTAPYISADIDYIWFKSDVTQRTTTTAELIGYDFPRTMVKYDNTTPYALREIIILTAGAVLTTTEENQLRDSMQLSIWWDNVLNVHGYLKGNRGPGQSVWTPESIAGPVVSSATIEDAAPTHVVLTFSGALNETSVPATSAFTLAGKTISNVAIAGAVATLTVTVAYAKGNTVTVSYTKPGSNMLKAVTTGYETGSFTGQAVTNNVAKYLYDTFTDTNNVHLHDHIMNIGAGWTEATGTMVISNNKLTSVGTSLVPATTNSGLADIDISWTCTLPTTNTYIIRFIFREQDSTHKWLLDLENDAGNPYLSLNLDGVGKGSYQAGAGLGGTDIVIRILAAGNSIKVYWNGTQRISITDSTYIDKTIIGVIKGHATYTDVPVDNLIVI